MLVVGLASIDFSTLHFVSALQIMSLLSNKQSRSGQHGKKNLNVVSGCQVLQCPVEFYVAVFNR